MTINEINTGSVDTDPVIYAANAPMTYIRRIEKPYTSITILSLPNAKGNLLIVKKNDSVLRLIAPGSGEWIKEAFFNAVGYTITAPDKEDRDEMIKFYILYGKPAMKLAEVTPSDRKLIDLDALMGMVKTTYRRSIDFIKLLIEGYKPDTDIEQLIVENISAFQVTKDYDPGKAILDACIPKGELPHPLPTKAFINNMLIARQQYKQGMRLELTQDQIAGAINHEIIHDKILDVSRNTNDIYGVMAKPQFANKTLAGKLTEYADVGNKLAEYWEKQIQRRLMVGLGDLVEKDSFDIIDRTVFPGKPVGAVTDLSCDWDGLVTGKITLSDGNHIVLADPTQARMSIRAREGNNPMAFADEVSFEPMGTIVEDANTGIRSLDIHAWNMYLDTEHTTDFTHLPIIDPKDCNKVVVDGFVEDKDYAISSMSPDANPADKLKFLSEHKQEGYMKASRASSVVMREEPTIEKHKPSVFLKNGKTHITSCCQGDIRVSPMNVILYRSGLLDVDGLYDIYIKPNCNCNPTKG